MWIIDHNWEELLTAPWIKYCQPINKRSRVLTRNAIETKIIQCQVCGVCGELATDMDGLAGFPCLFARLWWDPGNWHWTVYCSYPHQPVGFKLHWWLHNLCLLVFSRHKGPMQLWSIICVSGLLSYEAVLGNEQ